MKPARIIVFAKAPMPGFAKTRLIPALGAAGAARLASRMLQHTLNQAVAVGEAEVELCVSPAPEDALWAGWHFPPAVSVVAQGEGDLGARLARAADRAISAGVQPVLIGTDCPALDAGRLREAVRAMSKYDAYIHGTADGGYALLALARPVSGIFDGIPWSTSDVYRLTVERIVGAGASLGRGEQLVDIDEPGDLVHVPANWLEAVIHESPC